MKNRYLTALLFGAISLSGCGGGGSSGGDVESRSNLSPQSNTTNNEATIRKYKIVATPTSSGECRGAKGTMIIEGSSVSGTIKTGWGDNLIIGGTYSSQDGDISGGFAKNGSRLATYSGNMKNNRGNGIWSDSLGCSGTWTATGSSSNITTATSSHTTSTPVPTTTNSSKNFDAQNLQGYEINYQATGLISYKIEFKCDGSFTVNASRHGINVVAISGDDITIDSKKMILKSAINDEEWTVTLIDGNVVVGKSVDGDGNIIKEVKKISSCN
ncbi:hypothetical protein MNB_SV-12-595 [hydrothermal vent metagenome]|uniref:Lipoprotein n=1 Tax=hydrothermal vent metagenome TaxID=652676 RepID=A0A1W1BQQ5_9ZZZZ